MCGGLKKVWNIFLSLHGSSSLCGINENLAIDSGSHVYDRFSRIKHSISLCVSQRI